MNIGFDDKRISTNSLSCIPMQFLSVADDGLIDRFNRCGLQLTERIAYPSRAETRTLVPSTEPEYGSQCEMVLSLIL